MLTDDQIRSKLTLLRKSHGKVYAPITYFRGLKTLKDVERRYTKMLRKEYTPFPTDSGAHTKSSRHTIKFHKLYGSNIKSLPQIAHATGIDLATLRKVYNRGMAAWRTGHRPGASQQAWAYARVHSFVTKGPTYYTADSDLT